MCSIFFFSGKSYHLWEDAEKYSRARQAAGDSIIRGLHSACSITKATDTDTQCNFYCFTTATIFTRTRFSVRFVLHCHSCFVLYKALEKKKFIRLNFIFNK